MTRIPRFAVAHNGITYVVNAPSEWSAWVKVSTALKAGDDDTFDIVAAGYWDKDSNTFEDDYT